MKNYGDIEDTKVFERAGWKAATFYVFRASVVPCTGKNGRLYHFGF